MSSNDYRSRELPRTLIDVVQVRAKEHPDMELYTYLGDGENEDGSLTSVELERQSKAIGHYLESQGLAGERALMLYLSGLEYISCFFGCLFGGVVAVPAYPPDPTRLNRTMPRLLAIVKDAGCKVVLTTSLIKMMTEDMRDQVPELAELTWIATDEIDEALADEWRRPPVDAETLAFLQYTSGSTGNPKGVMLSHANLVHNVAIAQTRVNSKHDHVAVCWLPNFHDMGLIWGIIHPVFAGYKVYIMPPTAFLQKPYRWLKAMSKYKAHDSGGPNFAWDLAARKITPEQKAELDLSHWRVAFSGAEPIRPDTFQRFSETFAECGFNPLALTPAYGLAESAVYVASGWPEVPYTVLEINPEKMEQGIVERAEPGKGRPIVAIGDSTPDSPVTIVDPVTFEVLPEGRVGEMWIRGPSISRGYWARPQETAEVFHGYTSDTKEGPFLRSGDLGFRFEGLLYISGRAKDLIIIRGRNHYPQDIELTAEDSHPRVRKGCVACFSVEVNDEEELVVISEVDARGDDFDADEVLNAVRRGVVDGHDLVPWDIVLIKAKSITKTSSGKIQRRAAKNEYMEDKLEVVARLAGRSAPAATETVDVVHKAAHRRRASPAAMEMERFLAKQLAPHVKMAPNAIDTQTQFSYFGLDSKAMVGLSGDLEDALGRKLAPSTLYDHPTLAALAAFLVGDEAGEETRATRRFITPADEPIAVVGIGCRYPGGVDSPDSFWALLEEGRDGVREIPEGRWDVDSLYDPTPRTPGKMYTRWGGFLDGVDQFDPGFFGIAPREAEAMDPQQRLLLEVAWEALENAGLPAEALEGSRTGVYVGICSTDYAAGTMFSGDPRRIDGYSGTGNALSVAAGRISYLLGLQGPAMSVDTACSSSLVAVHLAAQSLLSGESDVALAGGVNLILGPEGTIFFSQLQAMAADGHCKTFDDGADGYVRSEGCGMVVLKRLSDAQADGDTILALVRGSAINQDGRSNGLTAPNGPSQHAVIAEALAVSGVSPDEVSYVEAHGTGTPLGDPIEVKAIGAALSLGRAPDNKVVVGSVKSNFGHAEGAAGVAGMIKTILAMQHGVIPKNLNFNAPSKHIPWDELPVTVPAEPVPWPAEGPSRIAGVSSFGFSGTNAHVILEEAPRVEAEAREASSPSALLLPLSAPGRAGLKAQAEAFAEHLAGLESPLAVEDAVFTASVRRSHHPYRLTAVGADGGALSAALKGFVADGEHPSVHAGRKGASQSRVVFVFPGQGSQWLGMGKELMASNEAFKAKMLECDAAIARWTDWSLLGELEKTDNPLYLNRIDVIQPTLWAIDVSLAAMWRSLGAEPDAVIGHSMGEVAAAAVAGALSLEHAAQIICRRSHLMRKVSGLGVMAVVGLGKSDAEALIAGKEAQVSVAVSNSDSSTVLSGDPATIEALMAELEAKEIFCRLVKVDVASHSPQMDPLTDDLLEALAGLEPKAADIPIYSTVMAEKIDGHQMDPRYWVNNLRQPVQFGTALGQLIDDGHTLFIEASPHPVLSPVVAAALKARLGDAPCAAVASLRREQDELRSMLDALGELYTQGLDPQWGAVAPAGRPAPLPAYPWQRDSYWIDPNGSRAGGAQLGAGGHPLLGAAFTSSVHAGTHFWQASLSVSDLGWLADHKVQDAVVFPAAGFVELLLAAGQGLGEARVEIADLRFRDALAFAGDDARTLQIVLREEGPGRWAAQVSSRAAQGDDAWQLHTTATVKRASGGAAEAIDVSALMARLGGERDGSAHYEQVGAAGLNYGPAFQGVTALRGAGGEALGRITLPEAAGSAHGYLLHPALLDACFQVMAAALTTGSENDGPAVPVEIGGMRVIALPSGPVVSHVKLGEPSEDGRSVTADIDIRAEDGALLVAITGLRAQRLEASAGAGGDKEEIYLGVTWREAPAPERAERSGTWLLISDDQGVAPALKAQLEASGSRVVTVGLKGASEGDVRVDPASPADFTAMMGAHFGADTPCAGIVHLASLIGDSGGVQAALRRDTFSALHLVQAIVAQRWRNPPKLLLVTRGAQAVSPDDRDVALAQSGLWGLGGTITSEHAELEPTRVDLGPAPLADQVDALMAEMLAAEHEEQVALRGDGRFVARLVRQEAVASAQEVMRPAGGSPYRLEIDKPGALSSLTLRKTSRQAPAAGEVEIAVSASGLNFRDVMMAMGLYDFHGEEVRLGGECAGTIVAVGEGVTDLKVGDEVIAITPHTFASHVVAAASHVVPRPPSLSPAEAAAMPSVFTTAWYALYELARLEAGESILIHSATGGTGMAAMQLAQRVGATVFATAGSEAKRQALRDMGIQHVYDSRSLDFAEQLLADTDGRGVDVVLNSLAGAAIEKGLACLAPDGRFLELGKRDIYADRPLGLMAFAKRITYTAIDLASYAEDRPARFRRLLETVTQAFASGELKALPTQSWPIAQAEEMFHTMARAQHIGKLAATFDAEPRIAVPAGEQSAFSKEGTYLISGGLGGLGLAAAEWMAAQGAGHLALMGRRGAASDTQKAGVARVQAAGATVHVLKADVSDRDEVAAALATLSSAPPLKGVIHAAGVLEDALLLQQDVRRFEKVMAPKITGALNLDALTRDADLDFFVLYSSAASIFGSPGQGNYAAANAFLDSLAHHRALSGAPGLSINWGAFSEVGLAAAQENRAGRLDNRGMRSLTPDEGNEILGLLLQGNQAQVGVVPLNVRQWVEFYPQASASSLLSELVAGAAAGPKKGDEALKKAFDEADGDGRVALMEGFLRSQVAKVLRIDPDRIERDTPLKNLGIDSLMGMELKNGMESGLGLALSTTLIWTYPTIGALAAHLLELLGYVEGDAEREAALKAQQEAEEAARQQEMEEELDAMSDDELAALGDDLLD